MSFNQPTRLKRSMSEPGVFEESARYKAASIAFAGRIGGNQEFVLDRNDPENASILRNVPDAAPYMTIKQSLDLRGFHEPELWKAAVMEGMGSLMICYLTIWISLSPNTMPPTPTTNAGVFSTVSFLGPLIGGISNIMILSLLIFCFAGVSGGHFNPLITVGTFFARLTSLPRMTLYVAFQTAGGAIAGLLVRASYDSRDFKTGGCFLFTEIVSVRSAFTVEFVGSLILTFLAFGVGLDPRQREIFGPALGPVLVGFALGIVSFGTAFTLPGYGGASLNPARCFGAFVGSSFPGWHWVHWVGPLAAAMVHGAFYYLIPPWCHSKAQSQTSTQNSKSA